MDIRKAKLSDADDLARLYLQFWQVHNKIDPLIKLKKKIDYKNQLIFAKKNIKRKDTYVFVAAKEGKVLGYIEVIIKKNDDCFRIRRYGYINSAVTHKGYRQKGIARSLTAYALRFLESKKIRYVKCSVYSANIMALKAWEKMGFELQRVSLFKKIG